jgi:hypothetical protein
MSSLTEIPDDSIVKLKQDIYTPIPEDTTLPDPERFVELVRDVQQNACMLDAWTPNLPLSLRLKVSGCHYNSIYNNTGTK